LPGPPIFACSASYGTAGHPVSRGQSRWLNGRKAELVVRADKLNPREAATRTLELVASSSAVFPPRFNLRLAERLDQESMTMWRTADAGDRAGDDRQTRPDHAR
jgi:hypothetical protein